jgi:hypothetical protein
MTLRAVYQAGKERSPIMLMRLFEFTGFAVAIYIAFHVWRKRRR